MSIVLKTDPVTLSKLAIAGDPISHDLLAAHAMQMAIEASVAGELPHSILRREYDCINERAAANLARLMGEGNG